MLKLFLWTLSFGVEHSAQVVDTQTLTEGTFLGVGPLPFFRMAFLPRTGRENEQNCWVPLVRARRDGRMTPNMSLFFSKPFRGDMPSLDLGSVLSLLHFAKHAVMACALLAAPLLSCACNSGLQFQPWSLPLSPAGGGGGGHALLIIFICCWIFFNNI